MLQTNIFDLAADLDDIRAYTGDSITVYFGGFIVFSKIPSSCKLEKLADIINHSCFKNMNCVIQKDEEGFWEIKLT